METRQRSVRTTGADVCAECGAPRSDRPYCGHCGARQAAPSSDRTFAVPEPAVEADEPTSTPGRRRGARSFATAAVLVVGALAVVARPTPPAEVVTVPGDLTNSGITSSVAPGSLDVQHWRLPLPATGADDWLWVSEISPEHLIVSGPWRQPLRVHRETGAVDVAPTRAPDGDRLVLEAGRIIRVQRDGTRELAAELPLRDRPAVETARELQPVGDLWIGAESGDIVAFDADLRLVWRLEGGDPASWLEAIEEVAGRVVLRWHGRVEAIDAQSGERVWERDDLMGSVLPAGDRLLATQADGSMTAIGVATGETLWTVPEVARGQWRTADAQHALLTHFSIRGLTAVAVALDDGRVVRTSEPGSYREGPWLEDTTVGVLLEALGPDGGTALLRADGTEAWRTDAALQPGPGADRSVRVDPATGDLVLVTAGRGSRVVLQTLPDLVTVLDVTFDLPAPAGAITGGLAVTGGTVAVAPWREGRPATPWLVDVASGERLAELPGASHLRATDEGFIIASSEQPWAADPVWRLGLVGADGAEIWRRELRPRQGEPYQLAGAGEGAVLVARVGERTSLELRSVRDGAPLGGTPRVEGQVELLPTAPDGSPVIGGWEPAGDQPTGPWLALLDVGQDGASERWRRSRLGQVVSDGESLVDVGRTVFRTIDPTDGSASPPRLLAASGWSSPAAAAGLLVLADGELLVAHDLRTGDVAWRHTLTVAATSTPVVAGDELLLGTADGTVRRFDLATGSERGSVTIGGTPVVEVVAVHGILLARDHEALVMRGPAELPRLLHDAVGTPRRLTPGGRVELPAP